MSGTNDTVSAGDVTSPGIGHGNRAIAALLSFFVSILVAAFARQGMAWLAARVELIEGTQFAEFDDVPLWLLVSSTAFFIVPFVLFYLYFRRVGQRLEEERIAMLLGQPNRVNAAIFAYLLPYLVVLPLMLIFMVLVL
ncbi:MAG: hypothetical protein WBG89_05815 [Ornithinimicrobium sp.]